MQKVRHSLIKKNPSDYIFTNTVKTIHYEIKSSSIQNKIYLFCNADQNQKISFRYQES